MTEIKRPRGIYRTKRPDPLEDDVWVEDGGVGQDIPESLYRARGYAPPIETLPWGRPEARKP